MNKSLWLIRLLSRCGKLTKQEILDAWRDEDDKGRPMAASTFYDNRRYAEERYGIRIVSDNKHYSIEHPGRHENPVLSQLLQHGGGQSGVPDTPALRGGHWLPLIAEAIEARQMLKMKYAPLEKPAYETLLSPYCLYPLAGCCYIVGSSSRHASVRTFALDRIEGLTLLPARFRRPADFSAKDYFRHSFGAFGGSDVQPEHVEIAARNYAAAYLRRRPLHASQRELPGSGGWARFEMEVAVTKDFVRELFSYGAELQVVAPGALREEISRWSKEVAEIYSRETPSQGEE